MTPFVLCQDFTLLTAIIILLSVTSSQKAYAGDDTGQAAARAALEARMNNLASNGAAMTPGANSKGVIYSTNILQEGDVVGITFQYSTNFNTTQKVGLDGTLNLDMVGPVKAAGKTVVELQEQISNLYKPVVKDDVITVKLLTSIAVVYVSGAVLRPGTLELDRPMTVLEAVMGAGGFDNTRAKLSDVTVLRIENGQQQTYHLNLKRVLAGKEKTPFYLKPFDIIYLPAKIFNY